MKIKILFLFLNLQLAVFSQAPEMKGSSKVFVEAKASMYKIAFLDFNDSPFSSLQYEIFTEQLRVSFNTDIVFRNNRVNTGIGNSWAVLGSRSSNSGSQSLPRRLFMRDVYAKCGYNLAHHTKNKQAYYGPYLQVEFITQDIINAFACYNIGFEIYENNSVRFSMSYGLFHFTKLVRNKYQARGETVFSFYSLGLNLGYSFPIRDPWLPH